MSALGTNTLFSPSSAQVDTNLAQTCCLLIHGYNGLAAEFDGLARQLRDRGFSCCALHLPGDTGPHSSEAAVRWSDWLEAITFSVRVASRSYSSVVLIGHSLGAALALRVAADNPEVSGVVALCPPLRMWPGEVRVIRALQHLLPWLPLPTLPVDITHDTGGEFATGNVVRQLEPSDVQRRTVEWEREECRRARPRCVAD